MIKSLNTAIDNEQMKLFVQELEERDEMLCFFNACAAAADLCAAQACGAGCIGITGCLIGLHMA